MHGLVVDDFEDFEGEDAIVDVDGAAGLDDFGDVFVVDVPGGRLARFPRRSIDRSDMFLSSEAVAYFSSVVMFSSVPALIGMSASPVVFPVRISGPF